MTSRASRSNRVTSASSDPHVLLGLEDRPQRIGDLAGGQRAGGDLVGQGLEEVEVAPVDERDLDSGAAQRLDRTQPAEASADDDDAVAHVWAPARAPRFDVGFGRAHGTHGDPGGGVGVGGVEGLGGEQRVGEVVELVAVVGEELGDLGVAVLDERLNLLVDQPLGLGGGL